MEKKISTILFILTSISLASSTIFIFLVFFNKERSFMVIGFIICIIGVIFYIIYFLLEIRIKRRYKEIQKLINSIGVEE